MWRSFFFAIGVMLIILGFECLIADRFEISNSARIPNAVARIFDSGNSPQSEFNQFANSTNAQNGFGNSNFGGSQFGPSRFGSQFDNNQSLTNANYYGGASSASLRQPARRPFSLAGFGGRSQSSNQTSGQSLLVPGKNTRVVYTKDWMPWSLLAAGTLVVLYTNATTGRNYSSD
jgi:hypothetical protein